ncbi:MAG: radical SAM protein, partial [Candidatus Omnitrophota bacterium]|nr:radical SAM protein [Candidatus Omnitrophota bacterium]
MKVLFVVRDMSFIEHLGVMSLSSIARGLGHTASLAVINEHSVLNILEEGLPDLVAFSIMSVDASAFSELAKKIKNRYPRLFIVTGGPHCTFNPGIVDSWPIDALIAGEGDLAFQELLEQLKKGTDFSNIKNLHTKQKKNELRALIEDLDSLPDPDRELVYYKGGHLRGLNVKSFMVSRGCAFSCSYCFNNAYNKLYANKGRIVRRRSVERIINEIKNVRRNYHMDFVRFGDDVFCYAKDQWLEEFADKYRSQVGLPFYCLIRPNLMTPEIARLLRRAGCFSVNMSIETGSQDLRYKVLNRKMSDEVVYKAFNIAREYNINVYANSMLGLPLAKADDEMRTVEMMVKCSPCFPSFTIFTPFEGIELTEFARKHDLIGATTSVKESTWAMSVLNCFTDKQKMVQLNIMYLGAAACKWPLLRPLILRCLIYLPSNRVFFFIWFIMKNSLMAKYIFPVKAPIYKKIKYSLKVFRYEMRFMKVQ